MLTLLVCLQTVETDWRKYALSQPQFHLALKVPCSSESPQLSSFVGSGTILSTECLIFCLLLSTRPYSSSSPDPSLTLLAVLSLLPSATVLSPLPAVPSPLSPVNSLSHGLIHSLTSFFSTNMSKTAPSSMSLDLQPPNQPCPKHHGTDSSALSHGTPTIVTPSAVIS